jgi:uncharacterized membrane protein YkoI
MFFKLSAAIGAAFFLMAAPSPGFGAPSKSTIEAYNAAKVSLPKAIQAAQEHAGAKAVSAEFETESGKGVYEVEVLKGKDIVKYKVDATTGQVTDAGKNTFESLFNRVKPEDIGAAKVTLEQAIGAAETQAGGKAIKAEVERESGRVEYEVDVLVGNDTKRVKIDGVSGQAVTG